MKTLLRLNLEKFDSHKKSFKDRRKVVSWAVFSYVDVHTNDEYRKGFEAPIGTLELYFWHIAPAKILMK